MKIARPFHQGLEAGRLLLPWCTDCGKPHFYPRSACPHCWGETYDWREAAGTGTVHTHTVVRSNPPPDFVPMLPYPIVIIDLDEGVRMMSNIVGGHDDLRMGECVRVEFHERNGRKLPMFRRVAA